MLCFRKCAFFCKTHFLQFLFCYLYLVINPSKSVLVIIIFETSHVLAFQNGHYQHPMYQPSKMVTTNIPCISLPKWSLPTSHVLAFQNGHYQHPMYQPSKMVTTNIPCISLPKWSLPTSHVLAFQNGHYQLHIRINLYSYLREIGVSAKICSVLGARTPKKLA